jgi:CRISPR system Cascade subunit CasE
MFISKVMLTSLKEVLAGSSRLRGVDNLYHQHQMLWTLFPDTPKGSMSLLFRQEYDKPLGFIVVSEKAPTPCAGWEVQTKPYLPVFQAGDLLSFKLTANPVVTKKNLKKPDAKSGARHDLVMDWIKVNKEQDKAPEERTHRDEIAKIVGKEWLYSRAKKHGFDIVFSEAEFEGEKEQLNITGYTQHRFEGHGKSIRLSTLDFDGVLRVTDPTLFQKIVLQGLGPAKGFGCGLMLVRRLG